MLPGITPVGVGGKPPTPYDIKESTVVYEGQIGTDLQAVFDLFIDPDNTSHAFVVGRNGSSQIILRRYAYTPSTGVIGAQQQSIDMTTGYGLTSSGFNSVYVVPGGSRIWVGDDNNYVGLDLGTNYSLTTASLYATRNFGASYIPPCGLRFTPNGLRAFIATWESPGSWLGTRTTTPAWSLASLGTVSKVQLSESMQNGFDFSPDGMKFIWSDVSAGHIYQHALASAWDITTLDTTPEASVNLRTRPGRPNSFKGNNLSWSPDGLRLYEAVTGSIFRYRLV